MSIQSATVRPPNASRSRSNTAATTTTGTIEIPDLTAPKTPVNPEHRFADHSSPDNNNPYGHQPMGFRLGSPPKRDKSKGSPQTTTTSPQQTPDLGLALYNKTPPSYTLNILVRDFTKHAERKLNMCLNSVPLDQEPDLVALLSEGVDPTFDRTIASLGYVAGSSRKRVTDAVMHWRRGKSELREMARSRLEQEMAAYREVEAASKGKQNANSSNSISGKSERTVSSGSKYDLETAASKVEHAEVTFTQADRQLSISTYILWRVLIEIVRQTPKDQNSHVLEEITYNYLRSMDPYMVSQSLIHAANWSLLAELLGEMSGRDFIAVSDRFIADLERVPSGFGTDNTNDASLNLLIHGMRNMKLSNASLERFEDSADFLKSLAKFFRRCENERLFSSYCEVLTNLLLSLAGTLTAEVNHPTWVDAVKLIYAKSMDLTRSSKPVYWVPATNLIVAVLCVSPKETFDKRWLPLVESLISHLKPKSSLEEKTTIVISVARLLWAYLYRYSDTLNAKTRKMRHIASLLFAQTNTKKSWLTDDPVLIQAASQIIRIMAYSQLNFTLENVLLPLLKSGFNGYSLEGLDYDTTNLAIRSYSSILWDREQGEQPPFPTNNAIASSMEPLQFSHESENSIFSASSSNAAVHAEMTGLLQKLLFLMEEDHGCKFLDEVPTSISFDGSASSIVHRHTSSGSSSFHRLTSLYFHSDNANRYRGLDLFATDLAAVTWVSDGDSTAYRRIIDLLVRNTVHPDQTIAAYCVDALKLLICQKNPGAITSSFATTAFYLDEKAATVLNHSYTSSDQYIHLLEVYVETLQSWLESLAEPEETDDSPDDLYNVNAEFSQIETTKKPRFSALQLKSIVNIIDDVEGNGLFFYLCHDSRVRFLGAQILRRVTEFDNVLMELSGEEPDSTETTETTGKGHHARSRSKFAAEFGTRAIQVLESLDLVKLMRPKTYLLSEAELKRYAKNKDKKATVVKLAESGHGVDAALWFKVYDEVLETLATKCPIQTAIARSHSCIRLVQLYDQVSALAATESSSQTDTSLVWDYMLFLKIACYSLTSTADQRVHLPENNYSNSKGHGRKRSQQVFTVQHQKITSAVAIFRITVPLLGTANHRLRDALVEGLSCINANILHAFLETAESVAATKGGSFSWAATEICCILYKAITRFQSQGDDFMDDWVLSRLQNILQSSLGILVRSKSERDYKYQRLRRYFCNLLEVVHSCLAAKNDVDRWLPFSFRKQAFQWMTGWCGYGSGNAVFQERYNHMKEEASRQKDGVTIQAALELQRHQLQYASISCMTELCASKTISRKDSIDWDMFFDVIDALFNTRNDRISGMASDALVKVLTINDNGASHLLDIAITKCYHSGPQQQGYATSIQRAFDAGMSEDYELYTPLSLSLYLAGSDTYNVRLAGTSLAEFAEKKLFGTNECGTYTDGLMSRARTVYKRSQFQLSSHFAVQAPAERFNVVSELTRVFHDLTPDARRGLVAVLLPWVQAVDLDSSTAESQMVLRNFCEITIKYGGRSGLQNEVEALWVALGSGSNGEGARTVFAFVTDHSLKLRSLDFIGCARQVVVSLASVPEFDLIGTLLSGISPKAMVPSNIEEEPLPSEAASLPYVADITTQTSTRLPSLSKGELFTILLVDLILLPQNSEAIKPHLSLLLHLSFILLDHQLAIMRNQARALLMHLVRQYATGDPETSKKVIAQLRSSEDLWVYSDFVSDKNSSRIPEAMDTLVRDVLAAFEMNNPDLQKEWSHTAIEWATSCKVMHLASRSFQVFRCLVSFIDQPMLRDMLSCLANTISDENPGIQSFALQILMTLNAVTAELFSEQLIDFPQLFWVSVASLTTIHEHEFVEVLSALSKFTLKIDLDSPDTVQCLIATFPSKWEGRFEGLQKAIMIGLRSANAYEPTLKLLSRMILLNDSEIIGSGKQRVLMSFLANIPRFLHAQTTHNFPEELVGAANQIAVMADRNEITGLSRILTSLVKNRFRNKEDFVSQVVNILKQHFFPEYSAETLVFLLGMLFNKIPWIKTETMVMLKHVFRAVDLTSDEFVGLGADLVAPLLRLLMTDYVDQALEVLDEATAISASPFDKHYLMMSAGDSSMRKEYEKIATLFGIPDESGWSVPMPAISTARTRNNIHSVYSTCVTKSTANVNEPPKNEHIKTTSEVTSEAASEVGSQMSEVASYVQYNPLPPDVQLQLNRTETSQDDTDSLSNMLTTLENLDSFFTKDSLDMQTYGHQYNSSVDTRSTVATNDGWGPDPVSGLGEPGFKSTGSFRTLMDDYSVKSKRRSESTIKDRNSASLESPSEGLFGFELLRSRKHPPRFSSGELNSPLASQLGSPLTPRPPHTPRSPRSPYGRGSRFSRYPRRSNPLFEDER